MKKITHQRRKIMKNKLNKIFNNLKQNQQLLDEILNEMLKKSTNKNVINMLETIQSNYDDIPRIEGLIEIILNHKIYTFDIAMKLSENIDSSFAFYISEDYDDDSIISIEFELDQNRIIEDIILNG